MSVAAVSSADFKVRAATMTVTCFFPNWRAVSRPIPRFAPVTSAIFFSGAINSQSPKYPDVRFQEEVSQLVPAGPVRCVHSYGDVDGQVVDRDCGSSGALPRRTRRSKRRTLTGVRGRIKSPR